MGRGLAAFASLAALAAGATGGRPNLVEASVSVGQQGASLRVTDLVRNSGSVAAPPSRVGFYLGRERVGSRALPRLPAGADSRRTIRFTIPPSFSDGSYRLRACADDRARVRESSERDNCRTAPQAVRVSDLTAPVFAGLERATTCIPGPVRLGGDGRSSPYHLAWAAAADNRTPTSAIVYDVYQASVPGSENFAAPTYTTGPDATTFTTPPLPDDASYYFVVRARDQAGNRDTNTVERAGVNLCL